MDIRYAGTASAADQGQLRTETTYPSAAVGQAWTHSTYLRLVAGAMAGISDARIIIAEWSAPFVLLAQSFTSFVLTAGALVGGMVSHTRTLSNSSVTLAVSNIAFTPSIGVAVDFTIRIGAPQLELGSFATSPILNPVGAPAATTREADGAALNISALAAATMYLEERTAGQASSGDLGGVVADDGTANNRLAITATGGTGYAPTVTGNGLNIATFSTAAITNGAVDRAALSYAPNAMAAALDGASLGSDASGALANNISRVAISEGERAVHLRALRLYAAPLNLPQLQALTLDGGEPAAVGISLPAIRRPAEAAERLIGLTQTHESPFDGTMQTLE
ncbi:MAG: hypothetical protein ACK5PU_01210, partial [bacterium]